MGISRKNMPPSAVFVLFIAIAVIIIAVIRIDGDKSEASDTRNGLFSWHDEVFSAEEQKLLLLHMRKQGLTELYQYVTHSVPVPDIKALKSACDSAGVSLYLLVGEPEWALDGDARDLISEIQRAALIGCAGIMVDMEPYSLDEWDSGSDTVMASMTAACIKAESAAERNGLELVVCISWFLDGRGYSRELEEIVSRGCGALAVMNYNRSDEPAQIETEAALCRKYGKRLINIFELQEAGKYGLQEQNTYSGEGLSALWESWERLKNIYPDQELSLALHEYGALKDISGK